MFKTILPEGNLGLYIGGSLITIIEFAIIVVKGAAMLFSAVAKHLFKKLHLSNIVF